MKQYLCLNGKFVNQEKAIFRAGNRAFRYGDAVFETLFASGGKLVFFQSHMERLQAAARSLKMNLSEKFLFNAKPISEEITKLLQLNRLFQGVRIRITVFRTGEGLFFPHSHQTEYLIEAGKLEQERYQLNTRGISISIFEDMRKSTSVFSAYKTGNSLLFIMASLYRSENQVDDCLILNQEGRLIEGISSNLFLVKGKNIYTPSLKEACVDGIMRRQLIHLARQMNYQVFDNIALRQADLQKAEEIILTNVISGIRWVGAYKNRRYYNSTAKKLLNELNQSVFGAAVR